MDLPRPGLLGLMIRLVFGLGVAWMGYGAVVERATFWNGFDNPVGAFGYLVPISFVSSWVVNELLQKPWGQRPLMLALLGLAGSVGLGALNGVPFGSWFGMYVWAWVVAFSLLLGPALLLAVVLRTPGCEMRSFAHLTAKVSGTDPRPSLCPGWIDRFDRVRLLGRF